MRLSEIGPGPLHLADSPWVTIEIECSLCPRRGHYRLARLAERYGAAVPLGRLLELVAADCTLMRLGEKPRAYEARCGARYVTPSTGPLPVDAPARAGAPRPEPPKSAKRKRLGPDGSPPTVAQMRRQEISAVSVTCLGLWHGNTCYGTTTLPVDSLGAADDAVFLDLCRSLRLVCTRCGGRKMHIVPVWPDVRQARAASLSVDTRPGMSGTRPEYQVPGLKDVPIA